MTTESSVVDFFDDPESGTNVSRHRFLADLAAATQPLTESADMMAASARLLAVHLHVDRCAYAEVEDERVFVITGDYSRGVPSIVGRWDVSAFGPGCVSDMLAGRAFVVHDTLTHASIRAEDLPAYEATNIRAVICVPLHKNGKFTAAMAVHQTVPRKWTDDELELVTVVVARCWEALERARITRDLQASEARYRAIVESSPECVKLVAADGTLLQMNAAGLRMIEAPDQQSVLGRSVYDLVAPEYLHAYRALNARVCGGESGKLAFEIIGLKGTRRWMETTAVPLAAPTGAFVQLGLTRDVTARHVAQRALSENRARLDYAVRVSGVGFWFCDLPFDLLDWDERVKEHFFVSSDERVTIDLFYNRIHPEDRERVRAAIDASIQDRASYDVVMRTLDPKSGNQKYVNALGGATYASDGSPVRFDGVTVDVTEQKIDQEQLAQLNEKLREQDQRKDEFLATLAHELRNPLAPIRTGLSILKLTRDADQAAKTREMMERQLVHLVRMVDDLLDISRITLGKLTLKTEEVDFRTVLNSALDTAKPVLESRNHELVVRLPTEDLPLAADATRLAQVVANLLNNAAKYTPHKGLIQISAERHHNNLIVTVADTGSGIPKEMLTRVFDMFVQVDRSLEHVQGGLGVGLALVRRLVELHGGTIEAMSEGLGMGSTFTVILPLAIRDLSGTRSEQPVG